MASTRPVVMMDGDMSAKLTPGNPQGLPTAANDAKALASLDKKLLLVDDRIRAVVHGFSTGLYLCGAGGLGKSYSVLRLLNEEKADFRVFNSRMTGKGLYQALERAPDAIHVLEDMERLTNDRDGQGVLRSALWAQPGRDREVTWTTGQGESRFIFRGAIIMLGNRPLADLPELRALATRIAVLKLEVSEAELRAHMRRIAACGFSRHNSLMDATTCLEVCNYVIAECRQANCPLDLRLLDNACLDYLQAEMSHAKCHWKDLVANRVRQSAIHFRHEVNLLSREERLEQDRVLCRAICAESADPEERLRLWKERTGRGQATFYRRKREIDSGEFDI
jgi:hypothetical protein